MPRTRPGQIGRFTLDEPRARTWLAHIVAVNDACCANIATPVTPDGPEFADDAPEILSDWDPRIAADGIEDDVIQLIGIAVSAGIVVTPAAAHGDASQPDDLDFHYSGDAYGGSYGSSSE